MLDHILVDFITAIRHSFDEALLQRQAVEERFQVDVFLGDVSWETSYSLPGEEQPPRVRADLSVDWPTWSQTSYRSWSIGELPDELPEIVIEVALRVQRLAEAAQFFGQRPKERIVRDDAEDAVAQPFPVRRFFHRGVPAVLQQMMMQVNFHRAGFRARPA